MKILLKILFALLLFSSITINFFFGAANLIEGKNLFFPYADTEFASKYTPEKFNKIKEGQTIEEVTKILGEPLFKHIDSIYNGVEFVYTNDGKLMKNKKSGDLAWYRSTIYFNSKKKVIKIDKGWSYD